MAATQNLRPEQQLANVLFDVSNSRDPVADALSAVEQFAIREGLTRQEMIRRTLRVFGDDPRSQIPGGEAIFKALSAMLP